MVTMDLIEFLRARIAEDEWIARAANGPVCEHTYDGVSYAAADTRAPLHVIDGVPEYRESCQTMRLLALPYATHPDYREEWRP